MLVTMSKGDMGVGDSYKLNLFLHIIKQQEINNSTTTKHRVKRIPHFLNP